MEEWKCKYCGSTFELLSKYVKSGHLKHCRSFVAWRDSTLTYEFLHEAYEIQGKSLPEIAEEVGLEHVTIIANKLKKYDISLRGISLSKHMPRCKSRMKETCLANFGTEHNFYKDSPPRRQFEARLFLEEGIKNVFQRQDVKKKTRDTWEKNYGTRNLWECDWYRSKIMKSSFFSSIHRQVVAFLQDEGIEHTIEYSLQRDDVGDEEKYFNYDVHIACTKKFIEVNGTYWHADARLHGSTDLLSYPAGVKMLAEQIWARDFMKAECAKRHGYEVLTIWEKDILDDWECCRRRIKEFVSG